MQNINPNLFNSIQPNSQNPIPWYSIREGHLTLSQAEVETCNFWQKISELLQESYQWEELELTPQVRIPRTLLQQCAELKLKIPPDDLKKLRDKSSVIAMEQLITAGLPPLFIAASLGSIPFMEQVLGNGADLNKIWTTEGLYFHYSPLALAFITGTESAVQWLIEQGAKFDSLKVIEKPLEMAFQNQQPLLAYVLIKNKFFEYQIECFTDEMNISLYAAAAEGNIDFIHFLLKAGASVNYKGILDYTPLHTAVVYKQKAMVQQLLAWGADIHAETFDENTPLAIAINGDPYEKLENFKADYEMITLLLENGARYTELNLQIALEEKPELTMLFSQYAHNIVACKNFDVNMCDDKEVPLFHRAIISGNLTLIQAFLLNPNLKKNISDALGMKPLILAVCKDNIEVIKLLLKNGFHPGETLSTQITPLHVAANMGKTPIVRLLLEHKADIHAQDQWGYLPLHYAGYCTFYTDELASLLSDKSTNALSAPIVISELHKEGRVPFAANLYNQVDSEYKWLSKEMRMRKLCAHIFELSGASLVAYVIPQNFAQMITLEGMYFDRLWMRKIRKLLEKTNNCHPFLQDACLFSEEGASKTDLDYLKRIQENKATFMLTGWRGHAVQFLFMGDTLAIINRHQPLEVFRFNPKLLSEKLIGTIRTASNSTNNYYNNMVILVKETLSTKKDQLTKAIEQGYPLGIQKVGNCIYASLEGALWAFLAIPYALRAKQVTEANQSFFNLQDGLKISVFNKYLDSHLNFTNPFQPDMALCYKIKTALFQNIKSQNTIIFLKEKMRELSINFPIIQNQPVAEKNTEMNFFVINSYCN